MNNQKKVGAVMVVGGGIGGMQAALDLAENGLKVYLVETKPCIGGVMSQLDKTFPTNDCAMCTMAPRLVEIGRHKDIEIITLAEVENIKGEVGEFVVTVKKRPRYVNEEKCTGCALCINNCPVRNIIYLEPDKEEIKLPPEDLQKVKKIINEYKNKKGPLMPVLQEINTQYRYLPTEILRYIADELGYPLSQVYQLATFYNAFSLKPKGENIIRVCLGTACYVKGGRRILRAFEKELNISVDETTPDMKFTLETVNCLGCCGQSPTITINEDIYGYMRQKMVPEVLRKYRNKT
jgi:NADH:ubiquinone oxidoreductase subunit E